MVSNMVLNLVFVGVLVSMAFRGPHTGLALASSIAAYLNAGLLYRGLRKDGVYSPVAGWLQVLASVFIATAGMVAGLVMHSESIEFWGGLVSTDRALRLLALVVSGMVCYALLLVLTGLKKRHLEKGSV